MRDRIRWSTTFIALTAGKKFRWCWIFRFAVKPTSRIAKYAAIPSRLLTRCKTIFSPASLQRFWNKLLKFTEPRASYLAGTQEPVIFSRRGWTWKIGGRDRDRTCGLIHAMDALSQLSYTPVTGQNKLPMVWQTAIILTNIRMKFHCDA
jgi:hypothetical protein